jgi:hypothetical protein
MLEFRVIFLLARCGIHHVFQSNCPVDQICRLLVPFQDIWDSVFRLSGATKSLCLRSTSGILGLPLEITILASDYLRSSSVYFELFQSFSDQFHFICHLLDTNFPWLIDMHVLGIFLVQRYLEFPSIQSFIWCYSNR